MKRFGVLSLLVAIGWVAVVSAIDCSSPPAKVDLKTCCPFNDMISKDIAEKCKAFLVDDATPAAAAGPKPNPKPCHMECVINATQIMNGDELDKAKLKTYLSTVLSASPDFLPVVQKAFETCAQMNKDLRATMAKTPLPPPPPNVPADGKMCKPNSDMLMTCVMVETMVNCPKAAWKNDDACNNNKDFFKNCKPDGPGGPAPPPPPPPK